MSCFQILHITVRASDATVHAGVVDGSAVLIFEDNGIEV